MNTCARISLPCVLLVFLTTFALTLPDHTQAEIKYFFIPAIRTSKNDGHDFLMIVPR